MYSLEFTLSKNSTELGKKLHTHFLQQSETRSISFVSFGKQIFFLLSRYFHFFALFRFVETFISFFSSHRHFFFINVEKFFVITTWLFCIDFMLDRQFTKNWPIIFPSLLHQFSCYSIHKGKIIHHWFCKSIQRFFTPFTLRKMKKKEKNWEWEPTFHPWGRKFFIPGTEYFPSLGQRNFYCNEKLNWFGMN